MASGGSPHHDTGTSLGPLSYDQLGDVGPRYDIGLNATLPTPDVEPQGLRPAPGKIPSLNLDPELAAELDVDVGKVPRVGRRLPRDAGARDRQRERFSLEALFETQRNPKLPPDLVRRMMLERGVDLARVRLHTDGNAAQLTTALATSAVTIGDGIEDNPVDSHIPLSEWLTWARWDSPK